MKKNLTLSQTRINRILPSKSSTK
uniref:Uncharacterized protein MANES_09G035300 n=1 Tax=Rhizophora mucronata TaxID=61149 RepID=A0A2P2J5L8_RHIMU